MLFRSLPRLIAQLDSPALCELKLQFQDHYKGFDSSWEFIDWREMTQSLISLHARSPSVTITFAFYFRSMNPNMPSVVERLESLIEVAIVSGVRVAIIRASLLQGFEWVVTRYPSGGRSGLRVTYTTEWSECTHLSPKGSQTVQE